MRSHYWFESCERKNTYRNSKVEGMEENNFHKTVIFLSFAIYLLSQGPFKDELWSICFCLVPFSWFMNIYIKKNNIRWNAGVIENSLRHDGFCFLSSLLFSYDHLRRFSHILYLTTSFYLSMCKHDKKEQSRSSKGNGNPFLQQGFFGSAMLCFKNYLMHMCRFMKGQNLCNHAMI